ncbi:MAG: galactokinase [Fodinibius sp.]|nr:galactokinase [Fodinibius sp.]
MLPAAVDKSIVLAMSANDQSRARFRAVDKSATYETDLGGELNKSGQGWPDYLLGVVDQLRAHGYQVGGFNCVFGGNIPIGAGMSSSAALEGGVLFGLAELYDLDIGPEEMARIAQKAENEFVGVQCGIMDQFVSLNGREGHALKLDCRSLEYEFYPFKQENVRIVLCDTGVRRELASSEYNKRRQQCEQGVATLQTFDSDIQSLRDVELPFLLRHQQDMDPVVFKRCKFVVEENKRVISACQDLKTDHIGNFGQRMLQSHIGLRSDYEVSCTELDTLVDIAWDIRGVLGTRMMGGGFGGCTINLVEEDQLQTFTERISEGYAKATGREVEIYTTKVSGGTHLINRADFARH